jgi:tetratricopeptide (TPR) repeat protein
VSVSNCLFALAYLCIDMEDFATAERHLRDVQQVPLGPEDRAMFRARADLALAGLAADQEKFGQAVSLALPAMRELLRRDGNPQLVEAMDFFEKGALEVTLLGRYQAAKDTLGKCLDCCRRTLPHHHFYEVFVLNLLAQAHEKLGEDDAAEECYREALKIARERVGPDSPRTTVFLNSLARVLGRRQKRPEADRLFADFVATQRARFGPDHFLTGNALTAHATLLAEWGDDAPRQEELAREALAIYQKTGGPARKFYTTCTLTLARACLHQGKAQEAETLLRDTLPLVSRRYGPKHMQVAGILTELALALLAQEKQTDAQKPLRESLAIDRKGTEDRLVAVGRIYRAAHRPDQALAVVLARRQLWPNDPDRLVEVARELTRCIPAGGADFADRCAGEAVRTLRQAVLQGYRAVARLQTDPAFAPLRKRPDYQSIIDTLEGKGKPVGWEKVRDE